MSNVATSGANNSGRYEIRVKGRLAPRWAAWFDGMTLTRQDDGTTLIAGPVVDQAALHGLLQKVRDLGLPVVSVLPSQPTCPTCAPPSHSDDQPLPEGHRHDH